MRCTTNFVVVRGIQRCVMTQSDNDYHLIGIGFIKSNHVTLMTLLLLAFRNGIHNKANTFYLKIEKTCFNSKKK
jgi:hypothetical protein